MPATARTTRIPPPPRAKAVALLRFLRLPLVFSAVADPLAGFLLMREPAQAGRWDPVLPLLATSACFYTAGMVFNDLHDVDRDRKLHPHRPLVIGEVSPALAWALGIVLLVGGLWLAWSVSPLAFEAGVGLAIAVLLYDFVLKRWDVPGAVALGAARALNLSLGALAVPVSGLERLRVWDYFVMSGTYTMPSGAVMPGYGGHPLWNYLVIHGTYIAVVTWISTYEEAPARRNGFAAGVFLLALVALGTETLILPRAFEPWIARGIAFGLAVVIAAVGFPIIRRFSPGRVFQMTKTGVMGIIALDAALAAGRGHSGEGALILALYVPAILLGRVLGKL